MPAKTLTIQIPGYFTKSDPDQVLKNLIEVTMELNNNVENKRDLILKKIKDKYPIKNKLKELNKKDSYELGRLIENFQKLANYGKKNFENYKSIINFLNNDKKYRKKMKDFLHWIKDNIKKDEDFYNINNDFFQSMNFIDLKNSNILDKKYDFMPIWETIYIKVVQDWQKRRSYFYVISTILNKDWNEFIKLNEQNKFEEIIVSNWCLETYERKINNIFSFGKEYGVWKNNNYDLSLEAKKISENLNDSENLIKNYFDKIIPNIVIKGEDNNYTYNLFLIIFEYLSKSELELINSGNLFNALKDFGFNESFLTETTDDARKYEKINYLFRLLKNTTYFIEQTNGIVLNQNYEIDKLISKCNKKYNKVKIQEYEYLYENITNLSVYFGTQKLINQQKIYYGAPGTGKSYKLNEDKKEIYPKTTLRITFHPSYSYSNFIGVYKPIKKEEQKKQIVFNFVPGPLINILIDAYKNPNENYLLIIEEINRANVSEVFGDFFQLIERNREGKSQYDISVNEDLKIYLNQEKAKEKKLKNLNPEELCFPPNLYIWATMNSSDQGTFPLDTAFKRRWDFEYIGIDDNEKEAENIHFKLSEGDEEINWNKFRKFINGKLLEINSTINEDKLLGPFFIGGNLENNDPEDNTEIIKNKVVPYLYEDVLKYLGSEAINKIFNPKLKTLSQIIKEFDKENAKLTDIFSFSNKEIEDNANNSNSNNNATITESQNN